MRAKCMFFGVVMLAATVSVFGTGAPESTGTVASPTQDRVELARPDPNKRYDLTMTVQFGTAVPVDEDAVMVAYWEDKFNVNINLIDITGLGGQAGAARLNALIAAGDIPDQFRANAQNLERFQDAGVLAELHDDVMRAYMPGIMARLEEETNGEAWRYGRVDGVRYGVVNNFWWPAQYRQNMILRGDWLENVGLGVPRTFDEFERMFYAFATEDPNRSGRRDTYGLSQTVANEIFGAFGVVKGHWTERDGVLSSDDIHPGMKEGLRYLAKWYRDGVLDPEFVTGENLGGYRFLSHVFLNDRVGSTSMGMLYHWTPALPGRAISENAQEAERLGIYDSFVFAIPPVGPDGTHASNSQGELLANSFLVFGNHLDNEPGKLARLFQIQDELYSDRDTFLTMRMGIQGTHWEYDEHGMPNFIGELVARDAQRMGAWGAFQSFSFLETAAYVNRYVWDWADERNFREGLKSNVVPNLVVTPARSRFQAELDKLREEAFVAIITGARPVDYFDEYVATWRRSGGDELTGELNAWYQANK